MHFYNNLLYRLNGTSRVLIRIAHLFAVDEDPAWSLPASVDVSLFFPGKKRITLESHKQNEVGFVFLFLFLFLFLFALALALNLAHTTRRL